VISNTINVQLSLFVFGTYKRVQV